MFKAKSTITENDASAVKRDKLFLHRENDIGIIDEVNLRLKNLLESLNEKKQYISRLMIKSKGKVLFIRTDELDWIEAAGNYVRLHRGDQTYLIRSTMSKMEQQLDPGTFVRIHRSTIVNLDRVKELQTWYNKDYRVILQSGTMLTLSRNYKDRLQNVL